MKTNESIHFQAILNFPDYFISDTGIVKHIEYIIDDEDGSVYSFKETEIKPYFNEEGFLVVKLKDFGTNFICYVHELVADAFNEIDESSVIRDSVRHIDGDVTNNCVGNLQFIKDGVVL